MKQNWPNRILRCVGLFCLLALLATVIGSVLACVSVNQLRVIPLAAMFLGLFMVFHLCPGLLLFSVWLAWFPPRRAIGWSSLLAVTLVAGLIASWWFQIVRPWDMYHEADGSRPGWEPVHMLSLTTTISCVTALVSVSLSALLTRWFSKNSQKLIPESKKESGIES